MMQLHSKAITQTLSMAKQTNKRANHRSTEQKHGSILSGFKGHIALERPTAIAKPQPPLILNRDALSLSYLPRKL